MLALIDNEVRVTEVKKTGWRTTFVPYVDFRPSFLASAICIAENKVNSQKFLAVGSACTFDIF